MYTYIGNKLPLRILKVLMGHTNEYSSHLIAVNNVLV